MRSLAPALAALLIALPARGDVPGPRPHNVTVHHDDVGAVPIVGPRYAPVTIDFFVNFDGRRSLQLHESLMALAERHPRRLRVVYRVVPSGDGTLAATAMEAYAQGRFLPFVAELIAYRDANNERMLPSRGPELRAACERAGVDWERALAAQIDGRHLGVLEANELTLRRRGAPLAPSVLINGALPGVRAGSLDLGSLEAAYDAAYATARAHLSDGVPLEHIYELMLRAVSLAARPEAITAGLVDGSAATGRHGLLEEAPLVAPQPGGHSQGPEDAPVVLRFYGNFLSRHGTLLQGSLRQLREHYPDELRLVVHPMFPEDASPEHLEALLTVHQAGECADAQGAFWRFFEDAYHRHQHRHSRGMSTLDQVEDIIRHIELDRDRFGRCMANPRIRQAIIDQVDAGRRAGIELSPSIVINGRMYSGVKSLIELRSLVDQELLPGVLEVLVPSP